MPTNADRSVFPTSSTDLDTLRQKIVNFQKPSASDVPDAWQRISKFHPGMQLRIDTSYSDDIDEYQRYTNYETAEVGEQYTAGDVSWDRKTFTSREDNVTITKITNSAQNVSLIVSIDTISKMPGFNKGNDSGQRDKVGADCAYLAQVAHYPDYENSYLKNGGFVAVTYIVIDGGTKRDKSKSTTDSYNKSGIDAAVEISNAKNVYLITALDRTKNMGTMSDFASQTSYALMNSLVDQTRNVYTKYSSGDFYAKALKPSAEKQKELFNSASLEIVEAGTADAKDANEDLISAQKSSTTLSTTLSNRVYNQGRYAMICCAGYSMTRLSGMWIGTWDPGWRYDYTMDANVNLQSSGMNTSNLSTFGEGYIRFVYNQIEDWELNAKQIYNIDDALLCPAHADGDTALNDEGNVDYPFTYWNAGAAWMIQPIYEFYQCYGDRTISTFDDNKELLKDILLPLLQKNANFWLGLCTPEYYTDAAGNACYTPGKASLANDEKYLIVPSYSPENWTIGSYSSTLGVNCAMDISSAKYSLQMAVEIENLLQTSGYAARVDKYEALLDKLPEYQIDESTGAIKEWCANGYNDNNSHRHLSHLYLAWPAFETQDSAKWLQATKKAILARDSQSGADQTKQSHCWLHKGLIAARIKDSELLTTCLLKLIGSSHKLTKTGLLYASLMTNHDVTGESNAYCTDASLGMIGVINEALLFSNTGEIELLPARPTNWTKGEFKNFRARTQADVSCEWNGSSVTCTIKSDIAQTIKVSYNGRSQDVTFAKGETKTLNF